MLKTILRSFSYALNGLRLVLHERNFRIHILAFILVCFAGFYFNINKSEWLAIFIISSVVFSLEIVNTAIEKLCDRLSVEEDTQIKKVKDLSAASVLIAAVFAIAVGLIIFLPRILL